MASFNQIAADAWASLAAAASRAVSAVAAAPAWWWVAAATMVVVAQLTFWYVRWRRIHARLADVPGLAMGVLGALPLLFRNRKRLYDFDLEMHRKFGKTYKSTTGMWQDFGFVQTIDPVNIEYFLKTNFRNYVKPEDLRRRLLELIGDGIFRINHGYAGEYPMWHMQRKTIAKIFYKNNFDGFLQKVFIKHSNTLCDVLRKHANGGSGGNGDDSDGDVADIQRLMYAFTLDSIADIGFGVPFNALTNPISVGAAFDQAQEMIFTRLFHPFFSVPVIGKLLYSDERLNERLITELDVFADNVITERRAQIAREQANGGGDDDDDDSAGSAKSKKKPRKRAPRGAAVGQDCLSLFLRNKDLASKLSNRQIRDIVMSLLLAGRDTTACTLSFAIAELLLNPDVLAKLHAEIDDKLAHTTLVGGDATVNADDLTQRNMPYLHGFIYEVRVGFWVYNIHCLVLCGRPRTCTAMTPTFGIVGCSFLPLFAMARSFVCTRRCRSTPSRASRTTFSPTVRLFPPRRRWPFPSTPLAGGPSSGPNPRC